MAYIDSINSINGDYLIAGVSNIVVCDTSASTVDKTATAMDYFSLDSNLSFKIKFTDGNTASSMTLNLNNTGAKVITTTTSNPTLVAEVVYDCYYNGTNYILDNELTVHTADTSNPHDVTKAQVGLGNCDNTADSNKSVFSANKLTTPRTTYVTLGTASTSITRDWSESTTTIPVSGILSVVNGGTGVSNLSSITVGNSSKLGNIPVQSNSIGGNGYETNNYWSYVEKSMFTTSGGYIKYSNGLLIQWVRILATSDNYNVPFPLSFSSRFSYVITTAEGGVDCETRTTKDDEEGFDFSIAVDQKYAGSATITIKKNRMAFLIMIGY
jgi:hypothetical protein